MALATATDIPGGTFEEVYSLAVYGDMMGRKCKMPRFLNLTLSRDQLGQWDPQKT